MKDEAKPEEAKPPKLKTLAQHNAAITMARAQRKAKATPQGKPNGIACPMCRNGELMDTNPNIMLASDPPQMDVHCPACGWTGHRLA